MEETESNAHTTGQREPEMSEETPEISVDEWVDQKEFLSDIGRQGLSIETLEVEKLHIDSIAVTDANPENDTAQDSRITKLWKMARSRETRFGLILVLLNQIMFVALQTFL